ncbi:sensor histidine kinase [Clostridium sp. A1-XYC3]|uniref:histidine kinase n=1 Tax=Clostridium tanneri TaxID=3037988 RepID=A0ABU4JPI6_9CLOT|nr:sensor histidine kinase [Clostridium sp. A1-XYC3]MDW8800060.1 sensor histidine kinase [Clostridium sp. A1-XYC3]
MKLKDFLKDRIAYTIIYFSGIFLTIIIMYLTIVINSKEYPKVENILYPLLISIIIYIAFLAYDYYRKSHFYNQLYNMLESSENINYLLNIDDARTREQRTYAEVLSKIYKVNSQKISEYEDRHKEYIYFINQWVHQMKTPVSVINLILQDQKKEEFRELFNSIGEENEKISHGIEMMLNHARLNEFNLDFKVESIDIIAVVRKVVNDNKKSLIRNSIFPKIIGDNSVVVETDKKWTYFVINQILVNAIKYSKEVKKENKYISFEIKEKESKVVLSVTDEGIGIPKEDLGRVFQAFFTGKNGRKTSESTGVGMYLSKRICDKLGHELIVESKEGQWTKFSIVFYKQKNLFRL